MHAKEGSGDNHIYTCTACKNLGCHRNVLCTSFSLNAYSMAREPMMAVLEVARYSALEAVCDQRQWLLIKDSLCFCSFS